MKNKKNVLLIFVMLTTPMLAQHKDLSMVDALFHLAEKEPETEHHKIGRILLAYELGVRFASTEFQEACYEFLITHPDTIKALDTIKLENYFREYYPHLGDQAIKLLIASDKNLSPQLATSFRKLRASAEKLIYQIDQLNARRVASLEALQALQ